MATGEHQTEKQTIYWEGYSEGKLSQIEEIVRLRKALKDISDYAKRMDDYYSIEALNKAVHKIMEIAQQALKEV